MHLDENSGPLPGVGGMATGTIVGVAIAVFILVIITFILLFLLYRRQQQGSRFHDKKYFLGTGEYSGRTTKTRSDSDSDSNL